MDDEYDLEGDVNISMEEGLQRGFPIWGECGSSCELCLVGLGPLERRGRSVDELCRVWHLRTWMGVDGVLRCSICVLLLLHGRKTLNELDVVVDVGEVLKQNVDWYAHMNALHSYWCTDEAAMRESKEQLVSLMMAGYQEGKAWADEEKGQGALCNPIDAVNRRLRERAPRDDPLSEEFVREMTGGKRQTDAARWTLIASGFGLGKNEAERDRALRTLRVASTILPPCAKCGAPGSTQVCSGCRVLRYCGRECQVAHWSNHKEICKMGK